jgi:hypothetical protein
MTPWQRIGVGHAEQPVLALFVPSESPVVVVVPGDHGDHVSRAAGWALSALGHGYRGGRLFLISDTATEPAECLVTIMAVDDALAGGHRAGAGPGAGLVERTLGAPQALAHLAAETGVDLP